ncbi:MAG: PIN domain nuclease [Rhodospirillaceae bacterium]|nr:PIN domain nuclease [Rhodospirillaceae bacterium]
MIVVDSSVWIDFLRGGETEQVGRLTRLIGQEPLIVGDLILCEVLQGVRSDREASNVEALMREFDVVAMLNVDLALKAAYNYRALRSNGIAVRTTIDLIIGTYCIEHGHALLHADRDFEPMERYLGLVTI